MCIAAQNICCNAIFPQKDEGSPRSIGQSPRAAGPAHPFGQALILLFVRRRQTFRAELEKLPSGSQTRCRMLYRRGSHRGSNYRDSILNQGCSHQKHAFMVNVCYNPECRQELRYLREGRVVRIVHGDNDEARLEHFWLCGPCSQVYEFVFPTDGPVGLKLRGR